MKFFYAVVVILLLVTACKKDNDSPGKAELLTSAEWKYDNGGIDQDRNGTIDIPLATTGLLLPCMMDNTGLFKMDGTGTTDEGPTKCDPSLPQTTSFTWKFSNNDTEIEVIGTGLFGLGGKFKILALTDTKFSLSKDTSIAFPGAPPIAVGLIVDLKH